MSDTSLHDMFFYGLVVLSLVALCFAILAPPKFVDNWTSRQLCDGEAAMKSLVRRQAKGQMSQGEFDEAHRRINEIFGAEMLRVERHIRLRDSIDARRARVARRRPRHLKLRLSL